MISALLDRGLLNCKVCDGKQVLDMAGCPCSRAAAGSSVSASGVSDEAPFALTDELRLSHAVMFAVKKARDGSHTAKAILARVKIALNGFQEVSREQLEVSTLGNIVGRCSLYDGGR